MKIVLDIITQTAIDNFDFPAILSSITGINGWEEIDGGSSTGFVKLTGDYYYFGTADGHHISLINIHDGDAKVALDGDLVFEGNVEDLITMPWGNIYEDSPES